MIRYSLRAKYGKILYDTDEGAETWKYMVGKVGALIAIGAGLYHFHENPIGISILITPLVLLVLFFNYESIVVFSDRFVYVPAFAFPWRQPFKEFLYEDLDTVVSPVDYEVKDLPGGKAYLNEVDSRRKIHVLYKDNTFELFSTSIPWGYLHTAAKLINQQAVQYAAR